MPQFDPVITETFRRAIKAFGGDEATARAWLNTPNVELEDKRPIDVLGKPDGPMRVRNLIDLIKVQQQDDKG